MAPAPDRRRATRIHRRIQAMLVVADSPPVPIELENLSVIGLRATVGAPPPPGARCRVEFHSDGRRIEARGVVVRAGEGEFAMRFEELPYESFERLQALLLSCADDPRVIAEELADRLGFLGESA